MGVTVELELSQSRAREILGVAPTATANEIRKAFRAAAKEAHPDRAGGAEDRFRAIMAAYERLTDKPKAVVATATAAPAVEYAELTIPALTALNGGEATHTLADGRRFRINLPAGMRVGDKVRAGRVELSISVETDAAIMVRGDDLWITAEVAPKVLSRGGRIAVETPLGRRIVWITRKAGERGLVRLAGQGLPARGRHKAGHLFIRLAARGGEVDSAARTLLRRFQAAWAA